MKACITLNDVIRRHYKTFEEVYTVYEEEEEFFEEKSTNTVEYEFGKFEDAENFSDEVDFETFIETKSEKKILNLNGLIDPMQLTTKFKFESKENFFSFLYEEMAFEIFAKTNLVYSDVMLDFLKLQDYFAKKNITLDVISQEISNSKPATLFFLSREKCKLNTLRFAPNYLDVWNDYQIVITADNYLIENKRPRRKLFKINTQNNSHLEQGISFDTLKDITEYFIK